MPCMPFSFYDAVTSALDQIMGLGRQMMVFLRDNVPRYVGKIMLGIVFYEPRKRYKPKNFRQNRELIIKRKIASLRVQTHMVK